MDTVQSLAFSPDGERLASGSFRTVSIWRHPHNVRIAELAAADADVACMAVSPTGAMAAIGEAGGTIHLDDVATGKRRLLANFKNQGKARILSEKSAAEKGDLTPLLKARVSWIIARQDRAWYAAGEARRRLKALGQTDDQIFALDGDWSSHTPADQALFTLARKLASSPVVLTDADVEKALKLTGPKEVVQLISYTTNRASFDRITEAAGLAIEN